MTKSHEMRFRLRDTLVWLVLFSFLLPQLRPQRAWADPPADAQAQPPGTSAVDAEDDLPQILLDMKNDPGVLLDADDSNHKLDALAKLAGEKPPVDVDAGNLISEVLTAGHQGSLRKAITRIVTKLRVFGDNPNFKIYIHHSPIPNAFVYPGKAEIHLTAGLFAYIENEDELAGVIAHEMTHDNPNHLKAKADSQKMNEVLDKVKGYNDLRPAQREELRADLGALDRMIEAGYNPWAQYDFEKRFTEMMRNNFDAKIEGWVFKKIFKRNYEYIEAHPAGEIRMSATKAYVVDRGFKQDLSKHTAKKNKFSPWLNVFRLRMKMYSYPLTSKWARRANYAFLAYSALRATGLTDMEAAKELSRKTGEKWDILKEFISPVTNAASEKWVAIKDTLEPVGDGIRMVYQPVRDSFAEFINPIYGPISEQFGKAYHGMGSAWDGLENGTKDNLVFHLALSPFYLLFGYMFYSISRDGFDGEDYEHYKDLGRKLKVMKNLVPSLLKRSKKGTLDFTTLARLLDLSQTMLTSIDAIGGSEGGIYYFRGINFYPWMKGAGLDQHRKLLQLALAELNRLPPAERSKNLALLMPKLERTPNSIIEDPDFRGLLKDVLGLKAEPPALDMLEKIQVKNNLNKKLRLLDHLERLPEDAPAALKLKLARLLHQEGLKDSARKVVEDHFQELVDYVFSDKPNPTDAATLTQLVNNLREEGTQRDRSSSQKGLGPRTD